MTRHLILILLSLAAHNCFSQTRYADSLNKLLKKESSPVKRFDIINRILEEGVNNGANIDTALCIEMVRLTQNLHNDSLLAIAYNMAGSYNARKGDYLKSLEYLFKAVPLAEKAADKRRISSLYFDISLVYIFLKNPKDAYYYNIKGEENLPDTSNSLYDFMVAQFDRNMVRYYLLEHKPDAALPYLKHLQKEGTRLNKAVIKVPSLFLSGAAYAQLGKKDSAEYYFSSAARISDSISSLGLKWSNDKYYIPFLLQNGRINEAKDRSLNLLSLGERNHNPDVKLTAAGFLRTIYDQLQKPDSAYYFSKSELVMKDSVFDENNLNKEQALAFNEKLQAIEEQQLTESKKKKQEQVFLFSIIAVGVTFIIILFIYQLRRRRREMEHKLVSQRERISKELHDNVGSQLSYISGNIDWLIDSRGTLSREDEMKKLLIVSETSKSIVSDLRETIWVIKKERIKLEEIADRVKAFLQDQISLSPDIEVEITEDIKKEYYFLPTESLNIYRICQETIANCIKHAQATKIVLKIISGQEYDYFFSIADNGKGFDTRTKKEGHYGLSNMAQRATECRANLSIQSEPGQGTIVTIFKQG